MISKRLQKQRLPHPSCKNTLVEYLLCALGLPQEQKRGPQVLPAEWRKRRVDRMDEMRSGQGEDRAAPSPPSPREMVPGFHVVGEGHTQVTEMSGKAQGLCQKTPEWMLTECGQGHLQVIKGETRVSEVKRWVRAPDSYVWIQFFFQRLENRAGSIVLT